MRCVICGKKIWFWQKRVILKECILNDQEYAHAKCWKERFKGIAEIENKIS